MRSRALVRAYLNGLTASLPSSRYSRKDRRHNQPAALRRDEVAVLQFLQEEVPD